MKRGNLPIALGLLVAALAAGAQGAPPPRTVADILQSLESTPRIPEQISPILSDPEPSADRRDDLFAFLVKRANARQRIGDSSRAVTDLRRAVALAPQGDQRVLQVLQTLRDALNEAGSPLEAQAMTDEALRFERTPPGQRFRLLFSKLFSSIRFGDQPGAASTLGEMDTMFRRLRADRGWTQSEDWWTSVHERARGLHFELQGKRAEAEQAIQTSLAAGERHLQALAARAFTDRDREEIAGRTGWIEGVLRDLVGIQRNQGKLLEAELTARKALHLSLTRTGRGSSSTARSLMQIARNLNEQGRYREAEAIAREALRSARDAGLRPEAEVFVFARDALGSALAMQQRWGEAAQVFDERALALENASKDLRQRFSIGSFGWALALIKTGSQREARQVLERMQKNFLSYGDRDDSSRVAMTRGMAGLSLVEEGRYQDALEEFKRSVPRLLELAFIDQREERDGPARVARLNYVLEGYLRALTEGYRGGSAPSDTEIISETFRVADFARGSAVQRGLSLGAARAAARNPELLKLVDEDERLQDRVITLRGIIGNLAAAEEGKRPVKIIQDIGRDLDTIQTRREQIRARIRADYPEYADLAAPSPVTLEQARAALRTEDALVSLYLADDRAYVWAISRDGPSALAVITVRYTEIADTVRRLRRALDVGDTPLERFPAFDVAAAHALYARLLAPVEPSWRSARTLIVTPHRALAEVPFALLPTQPAVPTSGTLLFAHYREVPWLIRQVAIGQLPSIGSLVTLAKLPPAPATRRPFLGFGDPAFSTDQETRPARFRVALRNLDVDRTQISAGIAQLPPLPDTREEILHIAQILGADPAKDVFVGAAASEKNVRAQNLADRRVIAFATHGLVAGDIDGLTQPALALSNPAVTGEADDGLLTMEEILGLRMNADWIVLSACNTAAADGAGGEALSGLGRAFFFAGARALLASNWPVETVSARLLTTDVFRRQAAAPSLSRAQALRTAMIHLMDMEVAKDRDGKPLYSYAHPMFWAPFTLVGDVAN